MVVKVGKKDRIGAKSAYIAELEAEIRVMRRILAEMDPKSVIESVFAGLTPLMLGYRADETGKRTRVQEIITAMGSQGLDERGGVTDTYYPDVEFDESMEAATRWPTPQSISQPVKNTVVTLDGSHGIANGEAVRTDGQPMFRPGATTPPPASAEG
jgi:hypothetical protein